MNDAHQAAVESLAADDAAALRDLLQREPALVGVRREAAGREHETLLSLAIEYQSRACAEVLIDAGAAADVECGPELETTPRLRALQWGETRLAQRMAPPEAAHLSLRVAAGLGQIEAVERWWGDPTRPPDERVDALFFACRGAHAGVVRWILARAERDDVELRRLIGGFGDVEELATFLIERRHTLHRFEEHLLSEWVGEHLVEADPRNVQDLAAVCEDEGCALERARQGGHAEVVRRLQAYRLRGERAVARGEWSRPFATPREERFLRACQHGPLQRIEQMLAEDPALAGAMNPWGQNGLDLQAAYGPPHAVDAVALLCRAGTPCSEALVAAAWWGTAGVLEALAEHGSGWQPERVDTALWTLAVATRFNQLDQPDRLRRMLGLLLRLGADVDAANRFGVTAFGIAAPAMRSLWVEFGATAAEEVPELEDFHEDLDRVDGAALVARLEERPELLRYYRAGSGCSPLLEVLRHQDFDLLDLLLPFRPRPDRNEAAALGDLAAVQRGLKEHRMRPWSYGHGEPERPLHFAALHGRTEVARELLAAGYSLARINDAEVDGSYVGWDEMHERTPLQIAAAEGWWEVVDLFVKEMERHRPAADR